MSKAPLPAAMWEILRFSAVRPAPWSQYSESWDYGALRGWEYAVESAAKIAEDDGHFDTAARIRSELMRGQTCTE